MFGPGCGHKGPPLPPFVRVPAAPADVKIVRRVDTIELQFTVPAANTDGTRPANIERVDVYGFAGPDIHDEDLFKRGPKIASVAVKAPRDPDETVEPDEAAADLDPLVGAGLDQGAVAHVTQPLTPALLVPPKITRKAPKQKPDIEDDIARPLVGPPSSVPSLTFVAVGVSTSGRTGGVSQRVYIPLVPPPPPPSSARLKYDETTMTVTWSAPPALPPSGPAAADGALPARPVWYPPPAIGYYVYEVPPPREAAPPDGASLPDGVKKPDAAKPPDEKRLSDAPLTDLEYADHRMAWGSERCFTVRTVETIAGRSVESAAAPPACRKLVDTFPPTPPKGVTTVAGEQVINLIWEPNGEKDLAGYIVLRGTSADSLAPIMNAPMTETVFKDSVPSGAHYFYAVTAVDKAGNTSKPSAVDQATARE